MRQHARIIVAYVCCLATIAVTTSAFAPGAVTSPRIGHATATVGEINNNNNNNRRRLLSSQNNGPIVMLPTRNSRSTTTLRTRTTTSLNMVWATPQMAALAGCVSGGFFAGGLHAMSGPDHLAALLPRCCGQRWFKAGRVGALWGMGHGLSATIIGVLAFALKNTFSNNMGSGMKKFLSGASHLTEVAVGLSLIVIGLMGIREAREWELENEQHPPIVAKSLSAAAVTDDNGGVMGAKSNKKRAVIFNGLLHGFSWDGAPSLAPAIAVATWSGNLAFLSAYAAGTMAAMTLVTTLVGEGTRQAGQFFQRPDIPQKLSLYSSVLAMVIGAVWVGLAFV